MISSGAFPLHTLRTFHSLPEYRLTILGLTYQYLTSKVSRDSYDFSHSLYHDEVVRLNPPLPANKTIHPDDTSIRPSDELRFALFRHWNLYDAMYHSPYVASKLGIWKDRGRKKLSGLLAKMGCVLTVPDPRMLTPGSLYRFSLAQCQQSYSHMDMDLKRELRDKMESIAPEYGLVELAYPSFVRSFGFRSQPLCASDVIDGVSALLEAAGGIALNVEVEGGRNGGEWFGSGRQWAMKRDDNKENIPVRKDGVAISRGGQGGVDGKDDREVKEEWWKNNFWVAWDALGNEYVLYSSSSTLALKPHY
jgi:cell division control protein 45